MLSLAWQDEDARLRAELERAIQTPQPDAPWAPDLSRLNPWQRQMAQLWSKQRDADITVVFEGEPIYQGHKIILSRWNGQAASPSPSTVSTSTAGKHCNLTLTGTNTG